MIACYFRSSTAISAHAAMIHGANDNDTLTLGCRQPAVAGTRNLLRTYPEAEQAGRPGAAPRPPRRSRRHRQPHNPNTSSIIRNFIAVDSALMVDQGNYDCHNTPRKPDPPRHWDPRD